MTDRIIEVGARPTRLKISLNQLVIEPEGQETAHIPVSDIATLICTSPAITLSAAVLTTLAEHSIPVVLSGRNHLPAAMSLPLQTHNAQSERHARQTQLTQPERKRIWQGLVQHKIKAQGEALYCLTGNDAGLRTLASKVRSGDPENLEAQAARRYWPHLFGDNKFFRGSGYGGRNALLNYGYAVLRAGTTRALCAAGLHPSLGLQHHNRHDAFCLASDMMEPFRPCVDIHAALLADQFDAPDSIELTKENKIELLQFWTRRYAWNGESRTLSDWLYHAALCLARGILKESKRLEIPDIKFSDIQHLRTHDLPVKTSVQTDKLKSKSHAATA